MKVLNFFTIIIAFSLFFTSQTVKGNDEVLDFGKDIEGAKAYVEQRRNIFRNNLSEDDRQIFDTIIAENNRFIRDLNDSLEDRLTPNEMDMIRDAGGNNLPLIERIEHENQLMDDGIKHIETFFAKASTLEQDTYVYINLTPYQLGYRSNLSWNSETDPTTISSRHYTEIFRYFRRFYHNGFIVGNLTSNMNTENGELLRIQLRVPAGTPILYSNDTSVILPAGHSIHNTTINIDEENGREVFTTEAEMLDSTDLDHFIDDTVEELNTWLSDHLGLPHLHNVVSINNRNIRTAAAIDRAHRIVDNYLYNIPNDYLITILESKVDHHDFTIQITNRILNPHIQPISLQSLPGVYSSSTNTIMLSPTHRSLMDGLEEGVLSANTFLQAAVHEFAHAVDYIMLGNPSQVEQWSSTDARFLELFNEESGNFDNTTSFISSTNPITYYGQTNSNEFFAEVFAAMFSHEPTIRRNIWNQMPQTTQYISNQLAVRGYTRPQNPNGPSHFQVCHAVSH